MTELKLKAIASEIQEMGLMQLYDYKEKVITSLLDNNARFYILDAIDARMASLDVDSAIIERSEESGYD